MKTLFANIRHAARNRETLTIGGGQFKAEELLPLAEALDALYDALPYVEDVLNNPEQLACFKPGVVQAHARTMRAVIARAEGQP